MRGKSKEIQSTPEGAYRFGEFEVYPSERQLHRQNIEAPLPPKAFDALMILLRKVLGHDAIQTASKYGYRFALPVLGEPGVAQTAYAHFVRAKELTNERSMESVVRARDLFWLCIAEDPGFAAAWAWLGRCCRYIEKFGSEPSVSLELARAAFRRALSIDPSLACAHHFYTQL